MNAQELIARDLAANLGLLKMTLSDFTDVELYVRPCAGANHAAWQMGHLIYCENLTIRLTGAGVGELPEDFAELFAPAASKFDDPAKFGKFGTRQNLFSLCEQGRQATIDWVKTLSDEDLEKPAPEPIRFLFPTIGQLASGQCVHAAMHIGQFQVIRRKLGKRVLF